MNAPWKRALLVGLFAVGGLAAPSTALAYGWPLKPFDREHAIRAFLGDPRLEGRSGSFHSGVDIAVPDGTPVYAVEPGTAFVYRDRVAVREAGGRMFGYCQIAPSVKNP